MIPDKSGRSTASRPLHLRAAISRNTRTRTPRSLLDSPPAILHRDDLRQRGDSEGSFGPLRAIDFHEGEKIDEEALKTLVRAAVTLNRSTAQS